MGEMSSNEPDFDFASPTFGRGGKSRNTVWDSVFSFSRKTVWDGVRVM
jgi:hypothetical protein